MDSLDVTRFVPFDQGLNTDVFNLLVNSRGIRKGIKRMSNDFDKSDEILSYSTSTYSRD